MKRKDTIKSQKEFSTLIKTGKFIKTKDYVIYYKDNNLNKIRFGIAISTKIGNAVTRNRLKRQTREIIYKLNSLFKNNKDYIIMIRKGCLDTSFKKKFDNLENSLVYTSGMGGVYPSGILIGRVDSVQNDKYEVSKIINVKPSSQIDNFRFVNVLIRK